MKIRKILETIILKNNPSPIIEDNKNIKLMKEKLITRHPHWEKDGIYRTKSKNHLVYVSKHNGACEMCSRLAGKIYIDDVLSVGTKKDGKYPLLSTAIEGGLFHDGCRHGLSTYFKGINKKIN